MTTRATPPGPVRFSIVINNYNYGRFLAQAIDSCLAQTHPAHEIIVVDDGSTDNSREVLAAYGHHPSLKVILQENQGQAAALQHGMDAATGDWILGLDSDDCYKPRCLEEIARRIVPGVDWVYFRTTDVDVAGQPTGDSQPDPKAPLMQGQIWTPWIAEDRVHTFPPQSFHCYSAHFLRQVCLYPNPQVDHRLALPPDRYLNLLAAFACVAVGIEASLGFYRVHHNSAHQVATKSLPGIRSKLRQQEIAEGIAQEKLLLKGTPVPPRFCVFTPHAYWPVRLISWVCDCPNHPYPQDRRVGLLLNVLSPYITRGRIRPRGFLFALFKYSAICLMPRRVAWWLFVHLQPPRKLIWRRARVAPPVQKIALRGETQRRAS